MEAFKLEQRKNLKVMKLSFGKKSTGRQQVVLGRAKGKALDALVAENIELANRTATKDAATTRNKDTNFMTSSQYGLIKEESLNPLEGRAFIRGIGTLKYIRLKKQSVKMRSLYKRGTPALTELRKLQKTADLIIPQIKFQQIVRKITSWYQPDFKYKVEALQCLQEATESFTISLFESSSLLAIHGERVTATAKDVKLARRIRGCCDITYH